MFCQNCGTQNADEARFCANCGSPMDEEELNPVGETEVLTPEPVFAPVEEEPMIEEPVEAFPQVEEPVTYEQPAPAPVYQPAPQPVYQHTPRQVYQPQPQPQPVYQQPAYQPYQPQPAYQPQYQPAPPVYSQPQQPAVNSNRVREAICKKLRSPLVLITTILLTLIQIIFVANALDFNAGSLYEILRELGMSSREAWEILSAINNLGTVAALLISLPGMLICLGMWLTYFSGFKKEGKISTAGLTIIYIIELIQFVFICLGLLIVLLAAFAISANAADASYMMGSVGGMASMSVILLLIIGGGIGTLVILYYVKILGALRTAKHTITELEPNADISGYMAVMTIIAGGTVALGGFITTMMGASNGITDLLSGVSMILMAAIVFAWRGTMKELIDEEKKASRNSNYY